MPRPGERGRQRSPSSLSTHSPFGARCGDDPLWIVLKTLDD
ncbi:hypothetical protein HMPREF0083_04478 [Aneurinibacillus aneurinilyticus ATCC 12856]|uniref:Uncharacterized protein n=1 Tax=Aneurinibacillus aneurinilyticus ATCC 12856 TaxID=649747 RepID=U1Y9D9_ANEAE|nr:hypothetical protein HMPREF0083_04478 [Aneurinibacillus aneurinilyticus ATCC 12856]